ncbi:MAG: Na+/H+ antiporter NhaA [Gammaproteobacteria bacterium]|nr:Na+/H+ antiporter NhaA [Gammaproteobacteria bacterium]
MIQDALRNFFRLEAAGAILLLIAAALAMVLQNSPLADLYQAFLDTPVAIQVGGLEIAKPLFLWVNDGLMAIFFFMIGMEVKREVMVGELSRFDQVLLPLIAGVGGIAVPAGIYYVLTADDPTALQGWAIPTATDIAFALGILALLGPRVPATLKIFLLTIAIIDDLGAITIIALFYTNDLSLTSLSVAAGAIAVLGILKWRGVTKITVYMLVGVVLWVSVLKSGVHATLAGVVLGFFIPLESVDDDGTRHKPLDSLIHDLHYAVAFGILPLFAFVNAGVNLTGMTPDTLFSGVPLAIVAGLFIGKQLGVFTFAWIAIKSGICEMPKHLRWSHIYGVAALCGVGFTMSLFIGSLAFEGTGLGYARPDRLGIIVGSLLSGAVGYIVLRMTEPLHDLEKDS